MERRMTGGALRADYLAGGRASGTGGDDVRPLIGDQAAYDAQKRKEFEKVQEELRRDANELAAMLQNRMNILGQSENVGDRQMAELYASYLASFSNPKARNMAVKDFRKNRIPGISYRKQTNMPPAWN